MDPTEKKWSRVKVDLRQAGTWGSDTSGDTITQVLGAAGSNECTTDCFNGFRSRGYGS